MVILLKSTIAHRADHVASAAHRDVNWPMLVRGEDMYSFEGNRVVRHTGTEFPIFQAPIGLISRADLVGAVSAAGGVGLMETASLTMPQMQEQFDLIRARSNRPFGLHLMIPALAHKPEREQHVLDWVLDGRT